MKEAIQKAIEGGWHGGDWTFNTFSGQGDIVLERKEYSVYIPRSEAFLDPLFWQSLGKSLGWGKQSIYGKIEKWKQEWHNFIDHLAEGKDPEEFFTNLLSLK